jgi:copper chaperone CopZ
MEKIRLIVELEPQTTEQQIVKIESALLQLKGVSSVEVQMDQPTKRKKTMRVKDLLFVPSDQQIVIAKKILKKMGVRII